jgi:hypothetical protein
MPRRREALLNVVQEGIKGDVQSAIKNKRWRVAIVLTFSGMDVMAYLGLPPGRDEVKRSDFIAWSERYIRFPGLLQLTGRDLYSARCGMVHTYGAVSRLSREGKARPVLYRYEHRGPAVNLLPGSDAVIVSIESLADAFFRGADQFVFEVFTVEARAALAEKRFRGMYHLVPASRVADFAALWG